jgi:hypothetical protein
MYVSNSSMKHTAPLMCHGAAHAHVGVLHWTSGRRGPGLRSPNISLMWLQQAQISDIWASNVRGERPNIFGNAYMLANVRLTCYKIVSICCTDMGDML